MRRSRGISGWLALAMAAAPACGRLDFDDRSDAAVGGDGAMLACNTAVDLGAIDVVPATDGAPWLAAALHGDQIVAAYASSSGVTALSIDLNGGQVRRGASQPGILDACGGDLVVAFDGAHALVTTLTAAGDGTRFAILDGALDLGSAATLSSAARAPQSTASMRNGDFAIAGADASNSEEVTELDPAGNVIQVAPIPFLPNLAGGSITPLADGGYAIAYYNGDMQCETRTLTEALAPATGTATTIDDCELIRLSGTRTTGTYLTGYTDTASHLLAQRFDGSGSGIGGTFDLGAVEGPSRIAADAAAYWIALQTDTSLAYAPVGDDGTAHVTIEATPYAGSGERYTYYVVGDGSAAYGVWVSGTGTATELYVMPLCAP